MNYYKYIDETDVDDVIDPLDYVMLEDAATDEPTELDYTFDDPFEEVPMSKPIAPANHTVVECPSSYYGSHAELGETDEVLYLAIPSNQHDPAVEYSTTHGSYSHGPIEPNPPIGTLLFDGETFMPFDVEVNASLIARNKEANSYWD